MLGMKCSGACLAVEVYRMLAGDRGGVGQILIRLLTVKCPNGDKVHNDKLIQIVKSSGLIKTDTRIADMGLSL